MSPKDTFEAPLELEKKKDIEPPPPPGAAPNKKPEPETSAPESHETESAHETEPEPKTTVPEEYVEGPIPVYRESLRRTQSETRHETESAHETESRPKVSVPEKRVEGPQPVDRESLRRTKREARHETEPGKRESAPESDRESDNFEGAVREHAAQRGVSVTEKQEASAEEIAKKETAKAKVIGWFTGLATGGGLSTLAYVTGAFAIGNAPILWAAGIAGGAIAAGGILYEILAKKIRAKYGGKRFE